MKKKIIIQIIQIIIIQYEEILNNKIQKYYEILLENKVPFNRATIPCILLYADNPNENSLLEKLKENIKVKPITTEEKYTINQFGEDEDYIWKYVGLKK